MKEKRTQNNTKGEKNMTTIERRLNVVSEATKTPVTQKSSRNALIKCGILNKNGNLTDTYKGVFVKNDKNEKT